MNKPFAVIAERSADNRLLIEIFNTYQDAFTFQSGMRVTDKFNWVRIYRHEENSL